VPVSFLIFSPHLAQAKTAGPLFEIIKDEVGQAREESKLIAGLKDEQSTLQTPGHQI
jgi:hypothetical protein